MHIYLFQRLLLSIPVVLGVSLLVFAILFLSPGDPVRTMVGLRASEERVQEIRAQLGLDRPLLVQYGRWLGRVVQGDLGISIAAKRPVIHLIGEQIPFTLRLTLVAFALSTLAGIGLGMLAAIKQHTWLDTLITYLSVFWFSMPGFWLGLMLVLVFGLQLRWAPLSGYQSPGALVLPVLTLALPQMGSLARLVRNEMLEVLHEDYIRTARAKGQHPIWVFLHHALPNALIPVVVLLTLSLPWLLGGAVIVETIFAWPGVGRLMYQALMQKDFPVVQGILLIIAISTVLANLLGDILTALLDPRIHRA
ncbi:ABC transporter permease [Candidatus Chloroploca sp. Khr17]|uniref:ABC transporter permease n=1 Tax=Candidatus Chloroploca sp. Khr17 TaxID=2496869 RepID=UPI00101E11D4|nr:ABC transporter permease [Candidatus Chloroploca sp. Khr17]